MKISATKLIETIENEINFYGGLKLYDTNKLVLTNTENCSFKDLISTVESINTLISNKFDICLDVEPEIIETEEDGESAEEEAAESTEGQEEADE